MKKPLDLNLINFHFKLDGNNYLESFEISHPEIPEEDISFQQIKLCREILEKLKGNAVSQIGQILTSSFQEKKIDFLLVKLVTELQKLKSPIQFFEFDNEELVCRCMGVLKSDIFSVLEELDTDLVVDQRKVLGSIADKTSLGSACGSCLPETKNFLPGISQKEQALFHEFKITPFEYQLQAATFIDDFSTKEQLVMKFIRGKGLNLFLNLPCQSSLNLLDFEKRIVDHMKEMTGIAPQLFFSFT